MAEYIERKAAIAVACKGCNKEFPNEPCEPAECHIQQGVFNIPAADVVPVVRCKDCKNWLERAAFGIGTFHECWINGHVTSKDDFCSRGERREGE